MIYICIFIFFVQCIELFFSSLKKKLYTYKKATVVYHDYKFLSRFTIHKSSKQARSVTRGTIVTRALGKMKDESRTVVVARWTTDSIKTKDLFTIVFMKQNALFYPQQVPVQHIKISFYMYCDRVCPFYHNHISSMSKLIACY